MSRILKFRAWVAKDGVMFSDGDLLADFFAWLDRWKESKGPYVVMQFTGLQDKNSEDIWEGDYLQNDSGRICEVKWHKIAAVFDCEPVKIVNEDNAWNFKPNLWKFLTKVGDKYSNPELLEQSE